ncbi:MAG: type II toxin-antitoxin system RelE/ParE family toxin [Acidobacteria bacterium]|nr:type II toxin-antitoxin system RelE/ParE family toxin [Acidobacteriota bacterium]
MDRFLRTNVGNVKQLEGYDLPLFRLRTGPWRLVYRDQGDDAIEVVRVRNRREAYRNLSGL